ncbi:MAG TPA: hypothetical protein VE127_11540 [Solirubrobacteraceae bacterium]|nr:hypothetical protein [Solirubrobacteraceae bacterium]
MAIHIDSAPRRLLHGVGEISQRAATASVQPLRGVVGAAADAGMELERRAVDRLIESRELERVLTSVRVQTAASQVLESEGARRLVDAFFDSGLFDQFVRRLLDSEALWELVDRIADSPAVTAAISGQGLSFADQVGEEMRTRSRTGDAWLERAAARIIHRAPKPPPSAEPEASPG